jgi:hypothetical protein
MEPRSGCLSICLPKSRQAGGISESMGVPSGENAKLVAADLPAAGLVRTARFL